MRSIILPAAVSALLLLLGGCGGGEEDVDGKLVLIATDDHEKSYPTTQGLYRMKALLEEYTDGRITMDIKHSAQLGSEKETIEQTKLGTIHVNRVNVNPLTELVGEMKVLALPYIFRDEQHMHAVCDGEIGRELLGKLRREGLVGLGYYDSGQRSFYANKPLRGIEDLEGLTIRVQKAPIMQDAAKAVGAVPTAMAFEDVYTALEKGTIDGAENNYPSWVSKSHFRVAKHYLQDEHSRVPEVILFSRKVWDKLPPEDRKIIRRAARESIPHQRRLWDEYVTESRARAEEAGCTIVTNLDREPFRAAMDSVYAKHAKGLEGYIERIRAVQPRTPAPSTRPTTRPAGAE